MLFGWLVHRENEGMLVKERLRCSRRQPGIGALMHARRSHQSLPACLTYLSLVLNTLRFLFYSLNTYLLTYK